MSPRRSSRLSTQVSATNAAQINGTNGTEARNNSSIARGKQASLASSRARPKSSKAASTNAKARAAQDGSNNFAVPAAPETPKPAKRRKTQQAASPAVPPPITPTPSAIGLMSSPINGSTDTTHASARPAEPHTTNALLKTPGGTRVVVYTAGDEVIDSQPAHGSIPPLPRPTTTTDNLLEEACRHLCAVDPRLKKVIEKHHCRMFSPDGLQEDVDPFRSLVSGIMAQQVSGAAAKSIKNKFIALFPSSTINGGSNPFPTPAEVAAADLSLLRTAGLSGRKAEYIKGLAEKFASGELSAQMLVEASDEEVLERLTAVRGLGKWSVEMFACFGLKRMDVFSTGDLGVQRGMAAWLGKDVSKLKAKGGGKWKYLSEREMLEHSAKFAPYRSLFMWYMWRIEDVNLDAIQGD